MGAPYRMKGAPAAPGTNPSLTPDQFMAQQRASDPSTMTPDSFMAQQGSAAAATPPAQEPGMLSKAWKWANTPLLPAGRAETEGLQAATAPPPQPSTDPNSFASQHPDLLAAWQGLKAGTAGAYADSAATLRGVTSPAVIATLGLGALGRVPGAIGKVAKAGQALASGVYGVQGGKQVFDAGTEPVKTMYRMVTGDKPDPGEVSSSPDEIQQSLSGAGTALMGGVGLTDAATSKVQSAVKIDPHEALTKAIKPGTNNQGWDVALDRAIPQIADTAKQTGTPVTDLDSLASTVTAAKKNLWQKYQGMLGPNANATIDGNQVADAMKGAVDARYRAQHPEAAEALDKVADTYRRPLSLQDAEDYLQSANGELHAYYAKITKPKNNSIPATNISVPPPTRPLTTPQ